ncbi:MAG: hypothetical protein WD894_25445 [Pirellulales bacterium]
MDDNPYEAPQTKPTNPERPPRERQDLSAFLWHLAFGAFPHWLNAPMFVLAIAILFVLVSIIAWWR